MRTILRLLVVACAATVSLAFAADAFAKPRLVVWGTSIQVTEDKTDQAPLKITIYSPTGYSFNFAQTPSAQIGTVHADLQALAISPDAIIQADGTVLAADPAGFTTNTCAPGAHQAVWLLHVTVSGQTIDVPMYLDATTGTETALGATKLQLCLSDPYDTAPATIRAPFGVKLINAKLTFNTTGVITVPTTAGAYLWRSTITPWNPATPAPDAAKTVEVQSLVNLFAKPTLKATVKKNKVTLSGTLTQNGQPVAGTVVILAGGKQVAKATAGADGKFTKTLTIKKKTTYRATITVAQTDTACTSPLPASQVPGGCVGSTLAGYTVSTPNATASPKKK